jgi:DNA mismatch endonuclease (patch repair protein)
MMAGIKGKDTKPEMLIRLGLHALGFRYRLHDRRLPGRPDMVLPRWRAAILVHGCFWHRHDCHLFRWPGTREEFWRDKIGRNVKNDARVVAELEARGWRVATVWECALKGRTRLEPSDVMRNLATWIRSGRNTLTIEGE